MRFSSVTTSSYIAQPYNILKKNINENKTEYFIAEIKPFSKDGKKQCLKYVKVS